MSVETASQMAAHSEVRVKVNAWVDDGISSLVLALNLFPDVLTVSSCEGSDNEPAHVCFKLHGSSEDHAIFASRLASELNSQIDGRWSFAIRVEWHSDEPVIELLVSRPHIKDTADAVATIASRFHVADSN